ncbi:NUDIX domain-containing protein [Candidatus Parcubacteria bacterium]|nr:NUDIX domain-containing protein [Candidatus Parcubacteria bacterium]
MLTTRRRTAVLIPYRIANNKAFIFLQKRKQTAQRAPGKFGFFGGGAINEQEKPEEVMLRETKEELAYTPENFWFLGYYEFANKELFVYCQEVNNDFEKEIKVLEGDFGKWFSEDDLSQEPNLIDDDKQVFKDFFLKAKIP